MVGIRRDSEFYTRLWAGCCIVVLLLTLAVPGEAVLGQPGVDGPGPEQISAVAIPVLDYSDTAVQGVADRPLQANSQLNTLVRGARIPAVSPSRLGSAAALADGFYVPTHRSLFDLRIALRL